MSDTRRFLFYAFYEHFSTQLIELIAEFFKQEFKGNITNIRLPPSHEALYALNNNEFITFCQKTIYYVNILNRNVVEITTADENIKINDSSVCWLNTNFLLLQVKLEIFLIDVNIWEDIEIPNHLQWLLDLEYDFIFRNGNKLVICNCETMFGETKYFVQIMNTSTYTIERCFDNIAGVHSLVFSSLLSSCKNAVQMTYDGSVFYMKNDPHGLYKNNELFLKNDDRWIIQFKILANDEILVRFDNNIYEIYKYDGIFEQTFFILDGLFLNQLNDGGLLFLSTKGNFSSVQDGEIKHIGQLNDKACECPIELQVIENNKVLIFCAHSTQIYE